MDAGAGLKFLIFIRRRLIYFAIAFFILFMAFFQASDIIINRIKEDLLPQKAKLIATGMLETVMVKIQIAIVLTILVLIPVTTLYFLRNRLSKKSIIWILFSIILFAIGFSFTYFLLLPLAVKVLTLLTLEADVLPYYSINQFIFFAFFTTVVFSLVFDMPVIIIWFTLKGFIDIETLKQKRKHFYVAIVILAAVITADPTPMSQLLLSFPLILLYELSLFLSNFLLKIRK